MAPRATIDLRQPEQPRYSMLNTLAALGLVADVAEGSDEGRWASGDGVVYQPPSWRNDGGQALVCDDTPDGLADGRHPANVYETPFVVYGTDACSTFGALTHPFREHARNSLLGGQSHQVALELWEGALRGNLGNSFAQADDAGPAPEEVRSALAHITDDDAVSVLACLDRELATALRNRQGYLWCPPQVLVHLVAASAVRWQGSYYVSPGGNVVVCDGGFANGVIQGGTDFAIVATGPIEVRLGPIIVLGDDASGVNAEVNDRTVWAERPVLLVTQPESAWAYGECTDVACTAPA